MKVRCALSGGHSSDVDHQYWCAVFTLIKRGNRKLWWWKSLDLVIYSRESPIDNTQMHEFADKYNVLYLGDVGERTGGVPYEDFPL